MICPNCTALTAELQEARSRLEAIGILAGKPKPPMFGKAHAILEAVGAAYGLDARLITSGPRTEHVVWPRQVAMYLMTQHTCLTRKEVVASCGLTHESTVNHAIKRVQDRMSTEPKERDRITRLAAQLGQPKEL